MKSAPLSVVEISPKTSSSLRLAIHRRSRRGGGGFLWNSAVDTHPHRPDTNNTAAGGAAKKKKKPTTNGISLPLTRQTDSELMGPSHIGRAHAEIEVEHL